MQRMGWLRGCCCGLPRAAVGGGGEFVLRHRCAVTCSEAGVVRESWAWKFFAGDGKCDRASSGACEARLGRLGARAVACLP
jgi:hypothetical protein